MKELNYNYVYFNTNYLPHYQKGIIDHNEYNALCLSDVENIDGVKVVPSPLDYATPFLRRLQIRHERWGRKYHFPFKQLWYKYFFKDDFRNNKPYCFIVANSLLPLDYLKYLRKHYPNCKIVKVHRDLVKVSTHNPEYSNENMQRTFDMRLSYDKGDCKKYGLTYFHEIDSKLDIPISNDYPLCDVFFCGAAKDRLKKLIQAYDKFTEAGLKCKFYIVFAKEEEKEYRDGIVYANTYMPYKEVLYNSVNARCMFDINQGGADGFTTRFLEAVMYNKRFITDNPSVMESPFYKPELMQVVKTVEEIDPEFVRLGDVDYHYNGEFSPIHLIEQIDDALTAKYLKKQH